MKSSVQRIVVAGLAIATGLCVGPAAQGQREALLFVQARGGTPGMNAPTVRREAGKLTITPQALQKPDLTYMLLPRVTDTHKGNAATKYLAAVGELPQLTPEESQVIEDALGSSLGALNQTNPRLTELLGRYDRAMKMVRDGARFDSADWETNIREGGITTLLPSLGKMRQLARVVALQARLDIQRHDWPAARDKLQTGYAFARHLGEGETLIESLVGAAIAGLMNNCVEDWVGEGGSPNLYWPLTNLPVPFADLRRAMSFEMSLATISIPEMKQMREGRYSAEIWNGMVKRFTELSQGIGGGSLMPKVQEQWRDLPGAVLGAGLYPTAKKFLMERGMTADQVEKMAVAEVLGRYWVRSYDEVTDNTFKWMGLPSPVAIAGLKQAEKELLEQRQTNQLNLLASILLPSLGRATFTAAKLDRQISMLRITEAIRAYAAEKGELPESLEVLAAMLPVPVDPTTGKAFDYVRNGDKANISSFQPNATDALSFELTLKK